MTCIDFEREITGDQAATLRREWLVTNGRGGWASGTLAGANTRRYHGFFVPARQPPLGRKVLVSKLDETAVLQGAACSLAADEYADGQVQADGCRYLERFHLEGLVPVWTYALDGARLEKRVWMPHGQDSTLALYQLARGGPPLELRVGVRVTARDAHGETSGLGRAPEVEPVPHGIRVRAGGETFWVLASGGRFEPKGEWRRGLRHRVETERGEPDVEDHYLAGEFVVTLQPGQQLTLAASLSPQADLDGQIALRLEQARVQALIVHARAEAEPDWVQQLVLAADQFIVDRDGGQTVIAGYHWFGDWGRDTMIALPGLTLATGRAETAAGILRTFARYVSQGMLPNRFPDTGQAPEYNTVDATLWYFHALEQHAQASGDLALARELWPVLEDIIAWHLQGTRYGIRADPADGLLRSGEPGVQLTWMDVKIGDWVVTPRTGKAVEINALWINALRVMAGLAGRLGLPAAHPYARLAGQAEAGFTRFWSPAHNHLFDVIDGPAGADPSLRPNQLLAISLPHGPLRAAERRAQAAAVLAACARELLTPRGLRTLSPRHADYHARYAGDQPTRDAAYHQGTVWAWLIGPFVDAHLHVHGDPQAARTCLQPFASHLRDFGLGSIAEIFEADPPHTPCGCIAQAWSVAEVLRAWRRAGEATPAGRS